MQENVCMWENVCMQGVIFEKTRGSRKREAKECRAFCVQRVESFRSLIIKSEFGFGNHINWYKTLFPTYIFYIYFIYIYDTFSLCSRCLSDAAATRYRAFVRRSAAGDAIIFKRRAIKRSKRNIRIMASAWDTSSWVRASSVLVTDIIRTSYGARGQRSERKGRTLNRAWKTGEICSFLNGEGPGAAGGGGGGWRRAAEAWREMKFLSARRVGLRRFLI